MKNNKGITIITLVTTIVVILILAAITIFYGLSKNTDKAIDTKAIDEVYSLLDAVTNRALMHRINPDFYTFVGTSGEFTYTIDGKEETYSSDDGWYLVSEEDELNELGISNLNGSYLVNYDNGGVIAIDGITYDGKTYYVLTEMRNEIGGGSIMVSHMEYDSVKKVNRPVLSNGMVPVKLCGGKWVVTSEDDESWYDYSKEQEAWANVMLKDSLTLSGGYTNEMVRNASLSELVGKEVTEEGSAYVWIPRYTATSVGGTGSKVIFSNLTNDTTSYNNESYSLPEAFTYHDGNDGEIALPGIWVSKYEAGFDR